jgi:adenine phosphoribosyltransferase
MDPDTLREIRDAIRAIPDYPKPGVTFRDITTLLGNARVFRAVVDQLVQPWLGAHIDRVAGIEYGLDEMEMHRDAVGSAERIILVDDLIATGGTAEAAVKLLRSLGAQILAACFIIDLPDLGGSARLAALQVPVRTLVAFHGH